ncbi:Uncharacterised protein [Shigella flexneri]|nr:Uncharacterised protein [Shigella flexneri]
MLETVEDIINRNAHALEDGTEMGNNPVDPFSDPTVERDQRFMERIENIKMLDVWRRRTGQPVSTTAVSRCSRRCPPGVCGLRGTVRRWRGIPRIILISHYLPPHDLKRAAAFLSK